MKSHFWSSSAVVSGTPPSITATARGSKYLGARLAAAAAHDSASSDGLITAVFPPASAAVNGPNVNMKGSFHAPMISVTPKGSGRTRM